MVPTALSCYWVRCIDLSNNISTCPASMVLMKQVGAHTACRPKPIKELIGDKLSEVAWLEAIRNLRTIARFVDADQRSLEPEGNAKCAPSNPVTSFA